MSAQANPHPGSRPSAALAWLRASGPGAAFSIGVDLALPFAVYSIAKPYLGDTYALMAAGAPPLASTVIQLAWRRRIDALALIVMAGLALSLLGMLGGGGPHMLQLRERLVMPLIGLLFLGSAAIGRPLIYQLARARIRRQEADAGWFEDLRDHPAFRRAMMVMTLAWGVMLVLEPAIAAVLAFVLTIPQFMVVSPIMGNGSFAALTAWTFWYARRRIGPLRRGREG